MGAYTSPHVSGWGERLDTDAAGFERAARRVRAAAERAGATQFEALTAAALAEFAEQGVDAAVVEAGLGGRLDATNVLRAAGRRPHERRARAHGAARRDEGGDRRREARGGPAGSDRRALRARVGAARALLGGRGGGRHRPQQPRARGCRGGVVPRGARSTPRRPTGCRVPGRLEQRGDAPLEIWDGAHNLDGVGWLLPRLPDRQYVVVASILRDKNAEGMLAALSAVGDAFVATTSGNTRALSAEELATLGRRWFERTETERDPGAAVARARSIAGPHGAVLVTGSLYLLADISAGREGVRFGARGG